MFRASLFVCIWRSTSSITPRDTPNLYNFLRSRLGASSTLPAAVVQRWRGVTRVSRSVGFLVYVPHLDPEQRQLFHLWHTSHNSINAIANQTQSPFRLQEQPTTSLQRPPVGVQSTALQYTHITAV